MPDIAGREARHVGSAFVQGSGSSDSRALFGARTDQPSDSVAQFCLRQVLLKQFVQRRKQFAEICRFPYIHSLYVLSSRILMNAGIDKARPMTILE